MDGVEPTGFNGASIQPVWRVLNMARDVHEGLP